MAMKLIKKTAEYKIFMRGDDRYAVQDASGKPVNGEEKVRILVEEDLIKVTLPSPEEEVAEPEDTADGGDETAEVAAEADDAVEDAEGEAQALGEAGEPETEPEPEPEEAPEEAEPEAEAEADSEAAEDEGEEESEEKDK
tara:strand:- start:1293 stop:1712 length:420 start_codon:yes stop_codon:yes gene_type:complete